METEMGFFKIAGYDPNNRKVFKNVYHFQETHGLSLTDILYEFKAKDILIDWNDYMLNAIGRGKSPTSTISNIILSVTESNFIRKSI